MMATNVVVPLVALLLVRVDPSVAQSDYSTCPYGCCQPGCRDVNTLNISISQLGSTSPYYAQVTSNEGNTGIVDNVCYTYFPVSKYVSLVFRSDVYDDGTNVYEPFFQGDIKGCPGSYRGTGLGGASGCDSSVANTYIVAEACPDIYLYYVCAIYGSGIDTDDYFRYGASPYTVASECCKDRLMDLASSIFRSGAPLEPLPNTRPWQCVTRLGNARSINEDTVAPENSQQLPRAST